MNITSALRAHVICVCTCTLAGASTDAVAQHAGRFAATGSMTAARAEHSATLLADGRVLIAGGSVSDFALASTEIYDPVAGTFRATAPMTAARRSHTATLLPDDRVLIVGGYGNAGELASAELYDPATGTFTATGNLITARAGHSAILLPTGKVLIVGGYGSHAYPNVAPAELYDPISGTFTLAGAYTGHDGCDFCAPSTLLADGTVLFPGQYPAQLYDSASDTFSAIGLMIDDQSAGVALMNGQVLFAGGEGIGRLADAELYNPVTHAFVPTGSMASRRVWHSLTLLPDATALAAGGETDFCAGFGCVFAGSVASAELYDPATGVFTPTGSMTAIRETHTATLLDDGRVLIAGGQSWGGIGIINGSTATAEIYSPDSLIPAPALVSISGDGQGQGAIYHAGTSHLAASDDPAAAGESVDIYCTVLPAASVLPPQVAIGGRIATLVQISNVPGMIGVSQLRVRVPGGLSPDAAARVRLTYIDRASNEVKMATR